MLNDGGRDDDTIGGDSVFVVGDVNVIDGFFTGVDIGRDTGIVGDNGDGALGVT